MSETMGEGVERHPVSVWWWWCRETVAMEQLVVFYNESVFRSFLSAFLPGTCTVAVA